ncbi:MAG: Saccharopine dehydrogenase [Chrysothrix sp. TS-e1954]|nr:MAG: Saccharopine dehydrogenase [Chrysothrix sp. TS-e1954]
MHPTVIHLRRETKAFEERSALTPTTARRLLEAGYTVKIERSQERIFADSEFEDAGAALVETDSWPDAPPEHMILGLKELPDGQTFPLKHTHVQFAHCYKDQGGWETVLGRFVQGGGTLLDLEFLADEKGRRVAAFGYHAGYAGAALALKAWSENIIKNRGQTNGGEQTMGPVKPFENETKLLDHIKALLGEAMAIAGREPHVLVMGARGRCGGGAVELFKRAGLSLDSILEWDLAETSVRPGPYEEIVESDIFVNCIYLSAKIPPFINFESLNNPKRKLSVVADVSCDTTNPHNPVPVYTVNTTFDRPCLLVKLPSGPPLNVISIDHLPTLLPREASEQYSHDLLPSLLELKNRGTDPVWQGAEKLFKEKVETLPH